MVGNNWSPTASMRTLNYFLQMLPSINQEYINWISLDNFYKPISNIESF